MNTFQKITVFSTVIIIIIRIILRYLDNKKKPIEDRPSIESALDGLMIAATLGLALTIIATTLTIQSGLGAITKIVEDAPEFSVMQALGNARIAIDDISETSAKEIFTDFIKTETDDFQTKLTAIQNHEIEIPKEKAMLFGESVFTAAKKSVYTTSYVSPSSWWLTTEGNAYFLKNEAALKRSVSISRIFIYANDSELRDLKPILQKQKNAGVTVFSIQASKLPERMSRDIIIVDDRLVGELILDKDTRDFSKVVVNVDLKEVGRVQNQWSDLLRLAKAE